MAADALDAARSEVRALLLRAARGAGLPLGCAEDLARAVAEYGGAEALTAAAQALEAPDHSALTALPAAFDTLAAGADKTPLIATNKSLIAAFTFMEHAQRNITAHYDPETRTLSRATEARHPTLTPRLTIAPATYAALTALAHRTYVPASAASRAGAGAGAIDND